MHAKTPHLLLLRAKDGVPDDLAPIMLLLCKHLRGGGFSAAEGCPAQAASRLMEVVLSSGMADVAGLTKHWHATIPLSWHQFCKVSMHTGQCAIFTVNSAQHYTASCTAAPAIWADMERAAADG